MIGYPKNWVQHLAAVLMSSSFLVAPVYAQALSDRATQANGFSIAGQSADQYCDKQRYADQVYFGWDLATIDSDAAELIATFATKFKRECAIGRVEIIAHTDSSGSNDYNQALSVRRAEAVRDALIFQGVPAQKITIGAKSEFDLAVSTGDGVRESGNRRATMTLIAPPRPAPQPAPVPRPVVEPPKVEKPSGHMEIKVAESDVDNQRGLPEYRDPSQTNYDILDVRLDEFEAAPVLNVEAQQGVSAGLESQDVTFQSYWNYSSWIDRASILVFDDQNSFTNKPIAELPVDLTSGKAVWDLPVTGENAAYSYVLRVFDDKGTFDQTVRKTLRVVDSLEDETVIGSTVYGEDATDLRNIDVRGSAMTFYITPESGKDVTDVVLLGRPVAQQVDGAYVAREIVEPGSQPLNLSYTNADGKHVSVERQLDVPSNDVFLVALGDLTVGTRSSDGRALLAADDESFDDTFTTGRGAFYLKGKIKGQYLVTAALDTTEDDIDNLFSNLSDKSPESLLRRIDPNRFYPVYGDDSTFVEDAPTQGRFYVRIEDGNDYLLWGNFLSSVSSSEIAQLDRGLYGAKAVLRSDTTVSSGENRYSVVGFAADPGTVPAREEFLATGGSVYFLENQDISIGSERVRLEIRDQDTGFIRETIDLTPHVDYTIDYIRGRVLLSRPVSAIRFSETVVRDGSISGDTNALVVRYEYSPGLTDIDGFTVGGRAEAWVNDGVRVGITGQREETENADQTLTAADLMVRKSEDTYASVEVARSDGFAFTERRSFDGGFSYDTLGSNLSADEAYAYHLEGSVGLADVFGDDTNSKVTAYYEQFEEGYSGAGRLSDTAVERFGLQVATAPSANSKVVAEIDRIELSGLREETTANVDYSKNLTGKWGGQLGLRYSDVEDQTGSILGSGERLDIGAQLDYSITEATKVYGFGQATLENDGTRRDNNRLGLGIDAQINQRLSARGEVSEGDGGLGAALGVGYTVREGEEYYLNYALDEQRTDSGFSGQSFGSNGQNSVTLGGRKRFNDQVSIYGEERASFGDASGLTHAYGVDLAPWDNWSVGASFEVGDIEQNGLLIERQGYTATIGYSEEDITLGGAFEWLEDTNNGAKRETWLFRSNLGYKVNPDWRALLRYNKAESNFSGGAFFNGDFTEFQVAGAYRPVDNNRLNALVRYTYYEDLPGAEQVSNSGATGLPAQKSDIFSVDGNLRLTDWLTIGGKYGYRKGEVSLSRLDEDFIDSEASLWIGRADIHFVKKWDGLLEIRSLDVDTAGNSETGALIALYRHFGDNAKVGLGYNFTDFSDDLTDLSYDDDGLFLNLIAKF